MKYCDNKECKNPAECRIIWGDVEKQQANLCLFHVEQLWNIVKDRAHDDNPYYWTQSSIRECDEPI
jgi:hypothetical protein